MDFALTPFNLVGLPLLGAGVAGLGTIMGLGGGFMMVPILMFLFPDASPATITSISLTVVFLNALSATFSNIREQRIDWRTVLFLAVPALPAAVLGALAAGIVSRGDFQRIFGVLLLAGAVYTLWQGKQSAEQHRNHEPNRLIRERQGTIFLFYVNELVAAVVSPLGGFVSSFFGIGGGVVHMPTMRFILKIPARVASATALAVLIPTSFAAVITHVVNDQYQEGWRLAGLLGIGALVGAQVGVYLAPKINQRLTLIGLAIGMAAVGLRQMLVGL